MSTLDSLKADLEQMILWADLRREQGHGRVDTDTRRLAQEIRAVTRKYEKTPRRSADEPEDLAAIRSLRPAGPRKLTDRFDAGRYRERLAGASLARAAGCTLGAAVEAWPIEQMQALAQHCRMPFPPTDYWTWTPFPWRQRYGVSRMEDFLRQNMRHVPADDDIAYTLLGLLILEDCGPRFTTADVAAEWIKYLPMACTAERVALDNLRKGVGWKSAAVRGNPYVEWIGAAIRADPWGYVAPGWPEKAAEMAYRDARVSHRANGVYGAMFWAAAIAAAFVVDDPLEACRIGRSEIPARCRLHADVSWALKLASRVKDFRHARGLVDRRFAGMSRVHTNNNACITVFSLALGGRDVTAVIANAVAMGLDNDCNAATAGSIVGAIVGKGRVPDRWVRPFRGKTRTYLKGREWFRHGDLFRRFSRAARKVWDSE